MTRVHLMSTPASRLAIPSTSRCSPTWDAAEARFQQDAPEDVALEYEVFRVSVTPKVRANSVQPLIRLG